MSQSAQPNPELTEAVGLVRNLLAGGRESPAHFCMLANYLLSKTVLATGETLTLHQSGRDRSIVSGRKRPRDSMQAAAKNRELFLPVKLNNQKYLYIFYENFLGTKDGRTVLKTNCTKLAYQDDREGHRQFFRFDYERVAPNHYPSSHLHVYGNWHHDALTKEMKKVHFPVLRVTIESVIRLLVNEFGVETNTDEAIWRPMLAATEQEFLSIARTQRTTESAPH